MRQCAEDGTVTGIDINECVVPICEGTQHLVFPSYKDNAGGVDYVRFVDAKTEEELLYYVVDEWIEDPQLVMGCIMAAIQNGAEKK